MTAPRRIHGHTPAERQRFCLDKHRWPDEVSAMAGALHALETHPPVSGRLFYYRCKECLGFHLTKKPVRGQRPVTLDMREPASG